MAMTATEIEKQALTWLRKNPGRPCCQHHWAQSSGITSPEHEMALGSLVRMIQAAPKKFPGLTVEEGVCNSCKAWGDSLVKRVILASEEPGATLKEKRRRTRNT